MKREKTAKAVGEIIKWYRENRRSLPWRDDPTPYHVWLSEIMLQQTRIEAVIPYYLRFLSEFPTVEDLAAADDDRLMKLWQGLGYYSRARNLKKTAVQITESGVFPSDAAELEKLSGIGGYTAGAIASIAFGEPAPAVDGNVLRVMTRLDACRDDVNDEKTKKRVKEDLAAVYPSGEDAALLTQGIMEIGERVCIPNGAPKCDVCPLAELCEARRQDLTEEIPYKSKKKPRRVEERTVLLIRYAGAFAVEKRSEKGLLAGLYEFPCADGFLTEAETALLLENRGYSVKSVKKLAESKHLFTHIEWNMQGYLVECDAIPVSDEEKFRTKEEIFSACAIPSAYRAYTEFLKNL